MKAIVLAFAVTLAAAAPAWAQAADSRWAPFLGCWQLTADNVRDGASAPQEARGAVVGPRETGPRVCVTPAPDGGARFETTVAGQAALDQTIVPNGTDRPVTDADCRGSQRAEWSSDGFRVFTRAEITCAGDPAPRRISGITMLTADGTWLDIQAIEIAESETVRVRRYFRADDQPGRTRAPLGAAQLSLDDVKEASAKATAPAVEAALVETTAGYDLRASQLVDLDESGVPDRVIDLIVAMSYPEKFVVERRGGGGGGTIFANDPFTFGAFGYPAFYGSYYFSPYYYSPFGYYRAGVYDGGFFGGASGGPLPVSPQPSGTGRVIDGRGYTRITPRDPAPSAAAGNLPRSRAASASAPDAGSSSSSSSSSSGSSGGGASAGGGGGYAAGTSSGDTGRTAQPR